MFNSLKERKGVLTGMESTMVSMFEKCRNDELKSLKPTLALPVNCSEDLQKRSNDVLEELASQLRGATRHMGILCSLSLADHPAALGDGTSML